MSTQPKAGFEPSPAAKPIPFPQPSRGLSEDWLAVCLGLLIFALSLSLLFKVDLLGWAVTTSVWTSPAKALAPASKHFASLPAFVSLIGTYLFLLAVLLIGGKALGTNLARFAASFTVIFILSYGCWFLGNWAYIAATPDKRQALKIGWSLNLTNESGYIIALLVGLLIANFWPRACEKLKEAIRPELYVKTAIVILGGFLGIGALEQHQLAASIVFLGASAIIAAYLIYWPIVYFISRRYFGFSREWAAPLSSGLSVCGVSAAMATGSAIKARPFVPIMVSSLVVIFAMVELMVLPFAAQHYLYGQPLVAGAWLGLAVKTDGAAVASGAIADSLIRAKALAATGVAYQPGWIMGVCTTVKVFIDVFIGVWAFVLAWVWSARIEPRAGEKVKTRQIWDRFPKFILGYVATFLLVLALGLAYPTQVGTIKASMAEANIFRALFFVMTFLSIGLLSNFRKLWQEGIAKLAGVYVLCLFGYIIWVGLLISWLFFHGVMPPVVRG
jgi:uncharacterized membrane protein YadS